MLLKDLDLPTSRRYFRRVNYAITRIATKGWCQGADRQTFTDPTSPACLVGSCMFDEEFSAVQALGVLRYDNEIRRGAERAYGKVRNDLVEDLLAHSVGGPPINAISWNDVPGREKEDVVKHLLTISADLQRHIFTLEQAEEAKWAALPPMPPAVAVPISLDIDLTDDIPF